MKLAKKVTKLKHLYGVFGMCEMEEAALAIIKAGYIEDKPNPIKWFNYDLFKTNGEIVGMISLLMGGWLTKGMYNGTMMPTKEFIERIEKKARV